MEQFLARRLEGTVEIRHLVDPLMDAIRSHLPPSVETQDLLAPIGVSISHSTNMQWEMGIKNHPRAKKTRNPRI